MEPPWGQKELLSCVIMEIQSSASYVEKKYTVMQIQPLRLWRKAIFTCKFWWISTHWQRSCTCKKHLVEAKRHYSDTSFVPKWKRVDNTKPSPKSCVHPQCANKLHKKLIQPACLIWRAARDTVDTGQSILLCPTC